MNEGLCCGCIRVLSLRWGFCLTHFPLAVIPKLSPVPRDVQSLTEDHAPLVRRMQCVAIEVLRDSGYAREESTIGFHVPPFISVGLRLSCEQLNRMSALLTVRKLVIWFLATCRAARESVHERLRLPCSSLRRLVYPLGARPDYSYKFASCLCRSPIFTCM